MLRRLLALSRPPKELRCATCGQPAHATLDGAPICNVCYARRLGRALPPIRRK